MTNRTIAIPSRPADPMEHAAEHGVNSAEPTAAAAPDSLAGVVQDLRMQAAPLLALATGQVSALAQRGMDQVRDTTQRLCDHAQRAAGGTVNYIRTEPVKATLIAAATGAALMALLALLTRSRDHA